MENKTKEELIELVEELQEKVERLENDVDYWQNEYDEMETTCDELQEQLDDIEKCDGIKDIDGFIFKLKIENLFTPELENYINHYLRFYNN